MTLQLEDKAKTQTYFNHYTLTNLCCVTDNIPSLSPERHSRHLCTLVYSHYLITIRAYPVMPGKSTFAMLYYYTLTLEPAICLVFLLSVMQCVFIYIAYLLFKAIGLGNS